jgi:hypothetical protein
VKRLLTLVFAAAVVSSACGSSNPASPSNGPGATINGVIAGSGGTGATAGGMGRTTADPLTAGMTVSVIGTNISSPVDSANRFSLRDVPQGTARLRFSSAAVNASVELGGVQSTETIDVEVSVTPTSATIESVSRSTGSAEQLEGRVESLPPTMADGALLVAGRTVTTDDDTRILSGNQELEFDSLAIGQRVHVKGTTSGTSLLASVIDIQNTNVDIPVPINGDIEEFTGSSSAFQFKIDGRLIKGDSATEFFGDSEFSDIANGRRAEVKGLLRDGFVYASRMKVEGDDDDEEESASIEGLLESMGALPTPTLVVGGTTVTTTTSTVVRRKGDVQDLGALELGMTLHVVGDRQPDSSIVARMIQIKDDTGGGAFEIEGSAGGVKGTCPSLTFKVNGFDIATDGSTTFSPAPGCSAIKSGAHVKVIGTVQAGGSVKATSVEVK